MRRFLTALVATVFLSVPALAGWVESDLIATRDGNAKRPVGIFVRWDGQGTIPSVSIPPNTWVTIDLGNPALWPSGEMQPDLPEDTAAVFLSGLLVISHPGGSVTCDLYANFRAPGDSLPGGSYQAQTIEASSAKGIRSNAAVWVPVRERKFEFYWHHTSGCPSLINLSLQAYVR